MKYSITKKLAGLCVALSFLFTTSYGQLSITDTGNCLNHTLHATIIGTMPTGTGITADDGYSGLFPIGFTFNFYGTNYNNLVIGSNGVISFDATLAGAYCPWPINAALLGNASMRNAICGPWCDILISAGGSITRTTTGVAPNRKYAVTWCGSRMYGCTAEWTTSQIVLYETSNRVEVHTAHKTSCAWNNGRAITGVQNAAGTDAVVPPGRDWTPNWTVTTPPEAWGFSPTGPSYTVASIPYSPLPYATSAIYWYDSTTGAYLGTGPYLTVTPTVPTTYTAVALGCNDSTKAYIRVLPTSVGAGGIPRITYATYTDPSECGKCDGKIVLHGVNPHQIDTVFYSFNGVPQTPYVDSALLDSTITLDNLCGGTYDYVYVKVGDCPSNQVGPFTLVTPILAISNVEITNPSVCGKYDGSIKIKGLTPLKPVSIAYQKNAVAQSPYVGVVAADSTIVIPNLGAGNYTSFAATLSLCTANWPSALLVDPAPYDPSFTFTTGLGCTGDSIFVTNTTTPSGYHTYWNYGDGSAEDSLNTWHLYTTHQNIPKYVGSYVVTIIYNTTPNRNPACERTYTATVNFDHRLVPQFDADRDSICAGDNVTFLNTTISSYSPTFLWDFGNGDYNNVDISPLYEKYSIGGEYTVKLTATDLLGCVESTTRLQEIIELKVFASVHDTDVCLRTPMPIDAESIIRKESYKDVVTYAWSQTPSGSNLDRYDIKNPNFSGVGDYTLTVTANTPPFEDYVNGCEVTDAAVIRSHPPISLFNLTPSPQIINLGSTLQLNANGAVYYEWSPSNGSLDNPNINNPIVSPKDSVTSYTVRGMSLYGCMDSATIKVYVDQDVTQFVPSAFTPNGDGKNDVFRIIRLRFQRLVDFRVYNRWGQKIFQTSNPESGWDGTFEGVKQDMGTYTYEIIVALPNGENKGYKGNVTLIR